MATGAGYSHRATAPAGRFGRQQGRHAARLGQRLADRPLGGGLVGRQLARVRPLGDHRLHQPAVTRREAWKAASVAALAGLVGGDPVVGGQAVGRQRWRPGRSATGRGRG